MLYSVDSIRCYLDPSISNCRRQSQIFHVMHGPAADLLLYPPGKGFTGEAKILNINIIMKMGFVDCVLSYNHFF